MFLRGAARCLLASIAMLALIAATSPLALAQTASPVSFAVAAAAFERLPTRDRNEISLELMATGDFNGMASRQFGRRLYDAMTSFQKQHGLDPTGVATPETRSALSGEGGRIFNSWGFEFLDHPIASASIAIPARFGFDRTRTMHGYALVNHNGSMSIDFSFFPDQEATLDQVFENLTRLQPGRKITLQVKNTVSFTVAGGADNKLFYAQYIIVPAGIAGFTLAWDRDVFPNASRLATVMANELYSHRMLENGENEPSLLTTLRSPEGATPRMAGSAPKTQVGETVIRDSTRIVNLERQRSAREAETTRERAAMLSERQNAMSMQAAEARRRLAMVVEPSAALAEELTRAVAVPKLPMPTRPQPDPHNLAASGEVVRSAETDDLPPSPRRACDTPKPFVPWPPPQATNTLALPLKVGESVGDVDARLTQMLQRAGYGQFSYFSAPGGFSLATQIEKITASGAPEVGGRRWNTDTSAGASNITDYVDQLIFDREGYYRIFVFVLSTELRPNSGEPATFADAKNWGAGGCSALPYAMKIMRVTSGYQMQGLSYIFVGRKGQMPLQLHSFLSLAEQLRALKIDAL